MAILPGNPAATAPLVNPILAAIYGGLIAYAQFWVWLFSVPYKIAEAISPDFLKPTVVNLGMLVWEWVLPALTFVENITYAIFNFFDTALDRGLTAAIETNRSNTQHFKVALEAYIRLIQHKAQLIEKHGLRGIPVAFSSAHAA